MRHVMWFLVVVGCGLFGRFSDERGVCDAYLDCSGEVDPEGIGALITDYGEKSACWDTAEQAGLCASACQVGARDLIGRADEQRDQCELAAAGTGQTGPLSCIESMSEQRFADEFTVVMCTESEVCGDGAMASMWCDPATTGTTTGGSCTFEPARACDCLDGAYTCSEDFPGFEFVEPPQACLEVYQCGG